MLAQGTQAQITVGGRVGLNQGANIHGASPRTVAMGEGSPETYITPHRITAASGVDNSSGLFSFASMQGMPKTHGTIRDVSTHKRCVAYRQTLPCKTIIYLL